ncbi:MAG: hypothetical protein O3A63_07960 [Proteobacteria bacterium]|nr:hypothetical protein [Pseudomonadota bacterium]
MTVFIQRTVHRHLLRTAWLWAAVWTSLICGNACARSPAQTDLPFVGYGSETRGGEGGRVMWVDPGSGDSTLDHMPCTRSAPCQLRTALHTTQPRIIRFTAGGTIDLNQPLVLTERHSFVTVDGASAPSPGITISGNQPIIIRGSGPENTDDPRYATGHMVFSHLRLKGTGPVWSLSIDGQHGLVHHVVFDHLTWTMQDLAIEEPKMVIWYRAENITVSNMLFYDAYKGLQISGMQNDIVKHRIDGVSLTRSVFYNVRHRQPILRSHVHNVDVVNNIMRNYAFSNFSDSVTRIRNRADEPRVRWVNVINNSYQSPHNSFNEQARSIIFGESPGADRDDGGPAKCSSQGDVHTNTQMGEIWVAGNTLPSAACDVYSTTRTEIARPAYARIPAHPAVSLCTIVPQEVGMAYPNERERQIKQQLAECDSSE